MTLAARSQDVEWMDTVAIDADDYAACLADLAQVNAVTFAARPTLAFLAQVAARHEGPFSVLDVACGHGDMLRRIRRWASRRHLDLTLVGIDREARTAGIAAANTPASARITYLTGDVFAHAPEPAPDVVISSLFTHHLQPDEVVDFLRWMERHARLGWFVNDLHRHAIAYYGFPILAGAAGWHRFVRHDGRVSIARSFRRADWAAAIAEAGVPATISWHMPFRLCVSRLR